jgi:hypothetical protein
VNAYPVVGARTHVAEQTEDLVVAERLIRDGGEQDRPGAGSGGVRSVLDDVTRARGPDAREHRRRAGVLHGDPDRRGALLAGEIGVRAGGSEGRNARHVGCRHAADQRGIGALVHAIVVERGERERADAVEVHTASVRGVRRDHRAERPCDRRRRGMLAA